MTGRARADDGFTLVELVVATALVGLVTLLVATNLLNVVDTTTTVEERSTGMRDLRTALEILERDIRAANPIEAVGVGVPVSQYDGEVAFSVYCAAAGTGTCGADHLRRIRYRVVGNALERTEGSRRGVILGPSGPPDIPVTSRRGAVVNPVSRPVFRYFDSSGRAISTVGADAAPPAQFRNCVKEVRVRLEVVIESTVEGAAPTAQLETGATIRNYHRVAGC